MATKQNFRFQSSDGIHRINGMRWLPDQKPYKGILQIIHGMVEHIDRYDEFARFLCDNGYVVVGHDHLGHGGSINNEEEWGFFAEKNGIDHVVRDIHILKGQMCQEFADLPYFILGHSMGSFLARIYVTYYGEELTGAIIMGTACQPPMLAGLAKALTFLIARFKGWKYRSPFVDRLAFGGNNRKFKPARTPSDWLTRDEAIVDAYRADPRCTFNFTLSAYKDLFTAILYTGRKSNIARIPKKLPLFLIAGSQDPVGNFGKGVMTVYDRFKAAGIDDVAIKLYADDRHEILNETDRELVYQDIFAWMERYI